MIQAFKSRAAVFAVAVGFLPVLADPQASNHPTPSTPPDKSTSILGFTPSGAAMERHIEEEFSESLRRNARVSGTVT